MRRITVTLLSALALQTAAAQTPPLVQELGVEEHLGEALPKGATFLDAEGKTVRIEDYLDGRRPVLLVPAYYSCATLCNVVLEAVARAAKTTDWEVGEQYRIVTFSFDPKDGVVEAKKKKDSILGRVGEGIPAGAWAFLTGDPASIQPLVSKLGLKMAFDPKTGQYAHPAVVVALTPDGRISRYLYGIDYPVRDLKLSLLEASEGKTGSAFEKVLLACYRYDPSTRRYGLFVANFMRIGAAIIGLMVAGGLATLWRRERRRKTTP